MDTPVYKSIAASIIQSGLSVSDLLDSNKAQRLFDAAAWLD